MQTNQTLSDSSVVVDLAALAKLLEDADIMNSEALPILRLYRLWLKFYSDFVVALIDTLRQ